MKTSLAAATRGAPASSTRAAATAVLAAALALALRVAGPTAGELATALGDPFAWARSTPPDLAVAQLAAGAAWAGLGWTLLGVGLVAAARLPGAGGRVAAVLVRRLLPATVRRLAEAALGISLVAASAGPALAAGTPTPTPVAVAGVGAGPLERPAHGTVSMTVRPTSVPPAATPTPRPTAPAVTATPPLSGRPVANPSTAPELPADGATGVPEPAKATAPAAASAITVEPGDCLWHIAAGYLGDGSTDVEVDRAWRRWYAANRAVVGPDPGLIHPGQRLVPPPDAGLAVRPDPGASS